MRFNFLFLVLFAICSFRPLLAEELWNQAKVYRQAKSELELQHFDNAIAIAQTLKRDQAVVNWASLLIAEAEIHKQEFKKAQTVLKKVRNAKAAEVLARTLDWQIKILTSSDQTLPETNGLDQQSKAFPELKNELLYGQALGYLKVGDVVKAIEVFQTIRASSPLSWTALKSYWQTAKVVAPYLNELKGVSTLKLNPESFWQTEFQLLVKQKQFKAAQDIVGFVFENKNLASNTEEVIASLFESRMAFLKAQKLNDQIAQFLLEAKQSDNKFLKRQAVFALAQSAWNSNNYDAAQAALNELSPDSADRMFIEARVEEELGRKLKALRLLNSALDTGDKKYGSLAGLRLAWLSILDNSIPKAKEALTRVRSINSFDAIVDQQASSYWLRTTQRKADLPEISSPDYDLRAFYYWLDLGKSLDKPETQVNFSDTTLTRCDIPSVQGGSVLDNLRQLSKAGLFEEVALEVNLNFPKDSSYQNLIQRAGLFSQFGATQQSFKELLGDRLLYSAAIKNCSRNVIDLLYPIQHLEIYKEKAQEYQVPLALLLAVTRTESAFNPFAVSRSGALGLMQLMPKTAELEGFAGFQALEDKFPIFLPDKNIELGAKHLRRHLDRFDQKLYLAVGAYNGGPEAVAKWLATLPTSATPELWVELIPYKETRNYIKEVMASYWIYSQIILKTKPT